MNDRERIQRLQGALARLERLPASAERDEMLNKIRARAVDVETGETATSVPVPAPRKVQMPRPAAVHAPKRLAKPAVRPPQPRTLAAAPAPLTLVVARPREDGAVDLLRDGGLLSLEDAPVALAGRPWSSGLRG
jgi:hypothetical protein